MFLLIYVLLFIVAIVILSKGGTILVRSLVKIAAYLKMSDFVVGFILVAIATSIPELFVGLTAALSHKPNLALGSILGSNISNVTLIIGLVAILSRGIKIEREAIKSNVIYVAFVSLLPILLLIDAELSRLDGIVLIFVFLFYMLRLIKEKKRYSRVTDHVSRRIFIKNVVIAILGAAFLLLAAEIIVYSASKIAIALNFPLILLGLFMVAIGTSLPELIFEIKAVLAKREGMALGDLLGSLAINAGLVLGIVALISPFQVTNYSLFLVAGLFSVLSLGLFVFFLRSRERLSWVEGMSLLLLYIIFVIVEFMVKG